MGDLIQKRSTLSPHLCCATRTKKNLQYLSWTAISWMNRKEKKQQLFFKLIEFFESFTYCVIKDLSLTASMYVCLHPWTDPVRQNQLWWIHRNLLHSSGGAGKWESPVNLHGQRNVVMMEKDAGRLNTKSWQAVKFLLKCGRFSAWPLISKVYFGQALVPKVPLLRVFLSPSDQLRTVT